MKSSPSSSEEYLADVSCVSEVMTIICRQSVSSLVPTSHPPQMGLTEGCEPFLQLHGELCGLLDVFVKRLQGLGPALDVERTHFQKSGVQALCALQLAIAKARSLLNYCADSSKLYLVDFISLFPQSLWISELFT